VRGRRNGAREFVLATAAAYPDRLVIRTGALVTRVVLDESRRATGVDYLDGRHLYRADPNVPADGAAPSSRRVRTTGEVVLSAGAFNTPQLLKLSGIGPGDELRAHGIEVLVDLPGVGENLQDRYEVGVVSQMNEDFSLLSDCTWKVPLDGEPPDDCYRAWLEQRGVYTTNGVALAVIRRSGLTALPDLFIFGLPSFFRGYFPGYSKLITDVRNKFTWAILKAHTNNTAGSVRLRSADPRDTPVIDFRYFDEGNDAAGADLDALVDGVKFARRIMGEMTSGPEEEVLPGSAVATDDQLREWVKDNAWGHHASCTCKMGPADDPMTVVDSQFRVKGTSGLRVVDASVFPHIPGFFIVTSVYMVSEKASDVILGGPMPYGRRLAAAGERLRSSANRLRARAARHSDNHNESE
jgi:choline dehydrogenase